MKRIIVASKNKGKIIEINRLLKNLNMEAVSMQNIGIQDDIDENGTTFEENAILKAKEIYKKTGEMVLADDSGLEVDYLNGAPGIYSARFAGEDADDNARIKKLLSSLHEVPQEKRTARFVCVVAFVINEKDILVTRGEVEGYITLERIGNNGFGYDPVFYLPNLNVTMAQLSAEEKNTISHRGQALKKMVREIEKREL